MSLKDRLANGVKHLTRGTARKFLFLGETGAPAPGIFDVPEPSVETVFGQHRPVVLGILNAKGGCGKSTTAISLAVAARLSGEKAGVIDLDWDQRTCKDWHSIRGAAPYVSSRQARDLSKAIEDARSKAYSFLVVDTPGQDTAAATEVIRHADFILVPLQPTWMDITPTERLLSRLTNAGVRHGVVLTRVHDARRTRNRLFRQALLRHARVLNETIPNREVFSDAAGHGLAVFEFGGDGAREAAERVLRLYDEICDLLQEP